MNALGYFGVYEAVSHDRLKRVGSERSRDDDAGSAFSDLGDHPATMSASSPAHEVLLQRARAGGLRASARSRVHCRMFDGNRVARVQSLAPGAEYGSRQRRLWIRWRVIHTWTVLRGSVGLRNAAKCSHASR